MRIISQLSVDDKILAMKTLFANLNRKMQHKISGGAPLSNEKTNSSLSLPFNQ